MNEKRLQSLINSAVKANNSTYKAEKALNRFCEDHWGFAPSDVGCDWIIDGVFGGCGLSRGMSASEFILHMDAIHAK